MLRSLQKQKIMEMLSIEDIPFKILILDEITQDILSPLVKVSDLRDAGVTSHFLASSQRSQIREVPAIYFLSSTKDIEVDFVKDNYAAYFLNAVHSFKRSELETIAEIAAEKRIGSKVQSVFDQFLQFTSLQDNLFSLGIANSYFQNNIQSSIPGLVSLFVTLNAMPFIVSDNAEIGKSLEQKLKCLKIIKNTVKKPLLIILDRDFDLITPTKHVIGYVELVNDLFNLKLNKVVLPDSSTINMDTDSDFYKSNWSLDFPTVADTVDKELHSYRKELALRSLNEKSDRIQIQKALDSTPMLQKKAEIVNNNLNICAAILEQFKQRNLDDFYTMEQSFNQDEIMELSVKGSEDDILRLAIQLIGTKYQDLIEPILQKRSIKDMGLINYIKASIRPEEGISSKFRNLIFKKNLPIVNAVENILNQIKSQSIEQLNYYDPSYTGLYASEISNVVVYVNGGITYTEVKELKELEKSIKIPIIAGGSEVLNANEFIRQLKSKINN